MPRQNNRNSLVMEPSPSQVLLAKEVNDHPIPYNDDSDAPLSSKGLSSDADTAERFSKLRNGVPSVNDVEHQNAPGNSPVVSAGYEHSPLGLQRDSSVANAIRPDVQQLRSPPVDSIASGSVSEKEEDASPMVGNFVVLKNDERRKVRKESHVSKNITSNPSGAALPPRKPSPQKQSPHTEEELAAMAQRKKEESKAKLAGMFSGRNNSFSGSVSRPLSMSTSFSRQSVSSLAPSQRPPSSGRSLSTLPPTLPPSAANSQSFHPKVDEELPDGWTRRKIIPAADRKASPAKEEQSNTKQQLLVTAPSPSKQKKAEKEELISREPSSAAINEPAKVVKKKMTAPPVLVSVPLVAYAFRGPPPRPLAPITEATPDVWFREYRQQILEAEAGQETQRRAHLAQAKIDSEKSISYSITKVISDASAKLTNMAFVSRIEAENQYMATHEDKAEVRFAKYFPQLAKTESIICDFDVSALHTFTSLKGHAILTKNYLCIVCKGKNTVPNLPQNHLHGPQSQLHPVQSSEPTAELSNNSLPSNPHFDNENSFDSIRSDTPNVMAIVEAIPLARIISVREGITVKSNGKVFVLDLPHDLIKGDALQFYCRDGLVYQLRNIRHPNVGSDGSMFDGKAVDSLHRFWNHFDHAWRAAGGGADVSIEFRDF